MNIDTIKARNSGAGFCWFKPDTMRFFDSRVGSRVYSRAGSDRHYFVTSERDCGQSRLYTVRMMQPDGSIETISRFQQYRSASGAHARAKRECAADYFRIVGGIGDRCPEDHGGGHVIETESGFILEYTHGINEWARDSDNRECQGDVHEVFSCQLDECAHDMFSCQDSDYADLASFSGMNEDELREHFRSEDPHVIASCVNEWAGCRGWHNVDPCPESMDHATLERRWSTY